MPKQRGLAGLALLRQMNRGEGAYLVEFEENGDPKVRFGDGLSTTEVLQCVCDSANQVKEERLAKTVRFDIQGNQLVFVTVPLISNRQIKSCLCLCVPFERGQKWNGLIVTLQWFAVLFYGLEEDVTRQREKEAALRIAGFLESVEKAASASDFPEAASRLVESFRIQAGCDRVALATLRFGRVRLQAVSGVASSQIPSSEGITAMETLMSEAVRGNHEVEGGENLGGLKLREIEILGASRCICAPLLSGEKIVGAWLFAWKEVPADVDDRIRFLRTVNGLLGPQLRFLERTKPGVFSGQLRRLWNRAGIPQRSVTVAVFAAIGGLALWPIAMPVGAPCTLEPEVRRIVSAPFDGILRSSLVEPGEPVQAGQLLAELDDREIRWKLADANAQRLRAEKLADAAMSEGRVADSLVASLEAEGLAESVKVLRYRQENLQVKSPIAGRILRGDLERDEGAIVRMGETLFEVGSLETMRAEIEVRESDVALIRRGSPVRLRFDSRPGQVWEEELKVVSPSSEFRDGENVFICQATIDNSEGWLRPGGLGRARIMGPRKPAIWSILRVPANWIARWLP